jgi:hypothetical protein
MYRLEKVDYKSTIMQLIKFGGQPLLGRGKA